MSNSKFKYFNFNNFEPTSEQNKNKLINRLIKQGITNKKVLDVMYEMPRHLFVETALKDRAYDDDALPIGYNQTISSPYIVAKMTQLIYEADNMGNVLEIGTGSGYQCAILASLFKKVVTIERIEPLYNRTKSLINRLGFKNISHEFSDGFIGCKLYAPYDAIIMTASPAEMPEMLIEQLKPNGRVILPLNDNGKQKLIRLKNTKNGILKKEIDDVLFVPMLKGTSK